MGNRAVLKSATLEAHRLAESSFVMSGAFSDRARYDTWLVTMYQMHASLGVTAARILDDPQFVSFENTRLEALTSDLGLCPEVPAPPSRVSQDWAWGVLYVLNGSALGASMLIKSGAVNGDWPSAYLNVMRSYAQHGQLKRYFDGIDSCALDLAEAKRGADEVFCAAVSKCENEPHGATVAAISPALA